MRAKQADTADTAAPPRVFKSTWRHKGGRAVLAAVVRVPVDYPATPAAFQLAWTEPPAVSVTDAASAPLSADDAAAWARVRAGPDVKR